MIKIILFLNIVLFCSLDLNAGTETGNGGQGVYCLKNNEVILFDYYEAQNIRGIEISYANAQMSFIKIAQSIIQKINQFDPVRAFAYTQKVDSFISETNFVSHADFKEIPDSNSLILPKDCKLVQVAVQKSPSYTGEAYYYVNQDYWDKMNNMSKAGLILHEIIYREDISFGAEKSDWARYFNSTIASSQFLNYQLLQYNALLKSNERLPNYNLYKNLENQEFWFFASDKCYIGLSGSNFQECANLICSKQMPNARIAEKADIMNAYPNLGLSLKTMGIVIEEHDTAIYQIFNKELQSGAYVLLGSQKYQFEKNQTSLAQGLLCIAIQ